MIGRWITIQTTDHGRTFVFRRLSIVRLPGRLSYRLQSAITT